MLLGRQKRAFRRREDDPLKLPALLLGLQLVTPGLGRPRNCTCEPNTEENEGSIHLHGSHSPEDGPLLPVRI